MPVNHPPSKRVGPIGQIVRWLLPPCCLVCGEAAQGQDLCAACSAALPRNTPACARCGLPLPLVAPACGACLQHPPPFSLLFAPWRYEAAIAQLVPRFKFHHDLAAGRVLAQRALPLVVEWGGCSGVTRIIPMPLHVTRLGKRGYNQALELARPLAQALELPIDVTTLVRRRATTPQTELDAAARHRNLRGAFAAAPQSGEVVLLIDDVVTTGATVREAARTLLRAGAAEVRVLAMARAPEPGQR